MKATKKIVGAACALVAATALAAGSTFAWFSTNGTVDATGMKIEVSTNNAYLIISDAATTLNKEAKTMTLASSTKALLPSAYDETKITSGTETDGPAGTTSDIDTEGNWYTGQGKTSTDGTLVGEKTKLTQANFADYVVVDEIFVAVSAGSTAVKEIEMTVTASPTWSTSNTTTTTGEGEAAVTTGNNNSAISVLILYKTVTTASTPTSWNVAELTQKGNDYGAANHKFKGGDVLKLGGIEPSATYANYIQIKVMVYFDGNNEDVKTSNSKNLGGVTLDFQFNDPAQTTTQSGGGSGNS